MPTGPGVAQVVPAEIGDTGIERDRDWLSGRFIPTHVGNGRMAVIFFDEIPFFAASLDRASSLAPFGDAGLTD